MGAKKIKILITGGSGNLGTALRALIDCYAPDVSELDILNAAQCREVVSRYDPHIIIHAAAWTDVEGAEKNKERCKMVNVDGTKNMVEAAAGRRFVYISTDYVFDGTRGNYREEDTPNPTNYYAWTKWQGELIIKQYPATLIIRTAFKPDAPWPYPKAFIDQWVSHDFVSKIAPDILKAALMEDLVGVIHIAGERKRIYDLARQVSPHVGTMSINDVEVRLPRDTSLNISKWKKISSKSNPANE